MSHRKAVRADPSPRLHQQPSYQGPIVHAGSAVASRGDRFSTVDSDSSF